ncbi:hypothetical protein R5R35_006289 [Gryllus longicercus]|uniref:Uncharacterized protein n=2 Tax=Gryllus longicercus TaxID=2509291 RepID=A0AAN9W130_9ORTH
MDPDLSLDAVWRGATAAAAAACAAAAGAAALRALDPWGLGEAWAGWGPWGAAVASVAALAFAASLCLDASLLPAQGRAVLVTGCDSGFGLDVALRLHRLGCTVFAGCLQAAGGAGAKKLARRGARMHVLQLDVTNQEQVEEARRVVEERLPPEGLWGVVNNAGLSTFGHVEWVPVTTGQRLMDVNVWGMVRVLQAFLPLMRQRSRGGGRVVNVASMMGRQGATNRSTYCVTKYGVEALSDCLRYEMRLWDIHVAIIEPGNFVNATDIFTPESIRRYADTLWSQMPQHVQRAYSKQYYNSVVNDMVHYATKGPTDRTPVVDAMVRALLQRFPHARYQPMEPYYKLRTWVATHCPEWVYETLYM